MLERLVLKGTRAVLRRVQEGNFLFLSDDNLILQEAEDIEGSKCRYNRKIAGNNEEL